MEACGDRNGASVADLIAAQTATHTVSSGSDEQQEGTKSEQQEPNTATNQTVILETPGQWILSWPSSDGPKSISLLVTVAASESRTEPLPAGQLQALGMSSDIAKVKTNTTQETDANAAAQLNASELESQQKFWRWLLVAGLSCLAVESLLAAFLERRSGMELA